MAQPFAGVKIVDLSGLAGAYASRLFAALGADVIKIEPPGGSPLRRMSPFVDGANEPEASLWWAYLAMGTRSVVIDIEDGEQRSSLAGLLAQADIVVDDHGPDVLDGFGVGYEATRAGNPGVVWISISPFGLKGPKRHWSSSNLVAWAASGVLYTTGFEDEPPVVPGGPTQIGLYATSLNAAVGAVLGLRGRRLLGYGQLVDLSLAEACLAISPETGIPVFLDDRVHRVRSGNRRTLSRPFGLYPCSDGFVSILVLMPRHWEAMANWIHESFDNESIIDPVFADMAVRVQTMELIDSWVEELTMSMTLLEFFQEGQRRGIPITPVNTIKTLAVDPHLDAVGYWDRTELPGGGDALIPGAPFRTSADWWRLGRAPRLGEHTSQMLGRT
ncbi:MAG: CoA transferase [Actinomycetia bacterium]|nr:CoA transferase [Actinomycetes bacterium]MCP4221873.1 CoA transferase [Actinomycetes bacterium]MCP5031108.1 CoA transferase [Actinomycetes bacterium]